MEYAHLSQQDFALRLGMSPASLSSIFTGRTNPTSNHVKAIHHAFPEININWLMFGEGEQLVASSSTAGQEYQMLTLSMLMQVLSHRTFKSLMHHP